MYYECYMGTSPFCVIETQMHNMLQSASFTVRIYEPDIYNLNISSNIHQGHMRRVSCMRQGMLTLSGVPSTTSLLDINILSILHHLGSPLG